MKNLLLLSAALFVLNSCAVKTETHYTKKGYSKFTISGVINYRNNRAIKIGTVSVCNYSGSKIVGDSISVTVIKTNLQNEFLNEN